MAHPLHEIIGRHLTETNFPACKVLKDPACGGEQHLPLFVSSKKSRKTKYCNVDILVFQNNRVRVIIEIEESDIKPTKICGKFLTAALSSYFIHETYHNKPIAIRDALFIQILDTTELKAATSRIKQWRNLESSIKSLLPLRKSSIIEYKLLWGDSKSFQSNADQLCNCINNFLTDILN
jgi:hypothetical protein